MSERIFETLAIVGLNGYGKEIKSCAYLNKSTYEDPYFLDTLGDNAYALLKGAASVEDIARMQWILGHGRMHKVPIGALIKWCIDTRLQNSAIWLLERFDLLQDSWIWTEEDVSGFFPLVEASRSSQTMVATWLLDHGADPNRHNNTSPLIYAAKTHNLELFNLLLARGADINFKQHDYISAAWQAVCSKANNIVDRCIELGCYNTDVSPKGTTVNGSNIIGIAKLYGNDYAVEKLTALQKSLGFA
jgi:hypothetical protein